ncbi:MAG TPA: adenylate/guanylate cyclase domain-containing protein [Candidatus Tectomicrobia bacterium]|nr:adenylate/guanylate cyclase domain-containing protein [Candidatus Tectomicrobia bacterium]
MADVLGELRYAHRDAIRDVQGLLWTDNTHHTTQATATPAEPAARAPLTYTPAVLAQKILTSCSALEGERKQVTVLFADLKGSMELLADRDPEEARQLLDPVLEQMMAVVHRYEGTVNQVMGDGIKALFGAPIAHEDHAVRACYAALAMQEAIRRHAEEVRRNKGLTVQMRVGLNSGEVVVPAIDNQLHMDYSAIGQTTHLAARMEQLATPASILLTAATLRLVEGLVRVDALGPVPVKGLADPVEVFELVGATALRRRLQVATAYLPVWDLFKAYSHVEDRDDLRTVRAKITGQILTLDEALQDTVPAVLALFEALPPDSPFLSLDPLQRRRRTLEALKRVLLREGQVQPLLLVFEDLHWIDTETQAVLDMLVESLPTARVLLLVNYRSEYQHGWGSKTYYIQLRLDSLPEASADELLQALLGEDANLAPLTQLLIARTQGNPFFLEESVRTLVETGMLVGERGAYHLVKPLDTLQVPATVQALLAARIDRLPPEDKRLLQTAAVIGTDVPWPLLQAIAELPEEMLYRGLAQLQAAEFLYETSLFPERAYTFKHALTHEVAYGSLLHERRRALHARIVEALEALTGDRLCHDWQLPLFSPIIAAALGLAYALEGRVDEGLALVEHGVEQQVTRGRRRRLASAVTCLSQGYLLARRLEEARQRAEQACDLARQYQQRGTQAWALWLLGECTARQAFPEVEPAAGPLPPRSRYAVRQARAAGPGPHSALYGYRAIPCHGHDLLVAPGRSSASYGTLR